MMVSERIATSKTLAFAAPQKTVSALFLSRSLLFVSHFFFRSRVIILLPAVMEAHTRQWSDDALGGEVATAAGALRPPPRAHSTPVRLRFSHYYSHSVNRVA